ncbi:hypothetical protein ADEAN_000504800 [Angomonas deanei]|uniref:Uncharacterized protein n=1 Tax=Angomonas deanei TaxID=59799 RepID=A0A7G2CCM7_9TRYP|nr:hypothetical protein ADEAN_000504800 [Angomonas deanei]
MDKNPIRNSWTRDAYLRYAINFTNNLSRRMQQQQEEVDKARFTLEEQIIAENEKFTRRQRKRMEAFKRRWEGGAVEQSAEALKEEELREKYERLKFDEDAERRKNELETELQEKYPLEFMEDDLKMSLAPCMFLPVLQYYLRMKMEERTQGVDATAYLEKYQEGTRKSGGLKRAREGGPAAEGPAERSVEVKLEGIAASTAVHTRLGETPEPHGMGSFIIPFDTPSTGTGRRVRELPHFTCDGTYTVPGEDKQDSQPTESGVHASSFVAQCAGSKVALRVLEENLRRSIEKEEVVWSGRKARLEDAREALRRLEDDAIDLTEYTRVKLEERRRLAFGPGTVGECERQLEQVALGREKGLRVLHAQLEEVCRLLRGEGPASSRAEQAPDVVLVRTPQFTVVRHDTKDRRHEEVLASLQSPPTDVNSTLSGSGEWERVPLLEATGEVATKLYDAEWMEREASAYAWPTALEKTIRHVLYCDVDDDYGGEKGARPVPKTHDSKNMGYSRHGLYWRPLQISRRELSVVLSGKAPPDDGVITLDVCDLQRRPGATGKELAESDITLITPRFPRLPRFVKGGLLYIHGRGEFLSREAELSSLDT